LHLPVQPEKKIVPEPAVPLMGGSSQRWTFQDATTGSAPTPHTPRPPAVRSTPHARGQNAQSASPAIAARARAASSPER
jgi:hypothetical protein